MLPKLEVSRDIAGSCLQGKLALTVLSTIYGSYRPAMATAGYTGYSQGWSASRFNPISARQANAILFVNFRHLHKAGHWIAPDGATVNDPGLVIPDCQWKGSSSGRAHPQNVAAREQIPATAGFGGTLYGFQYRISNRTRVIRRVR